jgi:hypothetical protein
MQLGWVGGGTGNCIPGSLRERRAERELLLESYSPRIKGLRLSMVV